MKRLVFSWMAGMAAALVSAPALAESIPATPDPAIWQSAQPGAPVVHRASQVPLPAELGGFSRGRLAAVGPEDVAAGYGLKDGSGATDATVYLFRPGTLPEHKLKGSVQSFGTLNPKAFLWSAGPFDISAPTPLHAWKGVFKTGIGPDTVMDYLYFVELGRWTVKVRATLSGVKESAQEARIDSFVKALPWAQILAANGECAGAACKAPPFDSFRSHVFETRLGPLLATKMEFKPKEEAKLPVAGQADVSMFGKADIRRSDKGELVYVVAVPNFFTYRLVRLPPPVTQLFTEGFGTLSIDKPVYAMVIKVGPTGLMPRLYNGEPTAEAFGAALDGMVFEEAKEFQPVADFAKSLPE
ncbi:MAG TPA: hypothetical protein VF605_05425 [Allosphingosinicella sp.]|jgi:hypothetical protein